MPDARSISFPRLIVERLSARSTAAEERGERPLFDVITGTPGDDHLVGTNDDDTLTGLAGQDFLMGRNGNDVLDAGDDNDYLRGDAGDDSLFGGGANDYVRGGDGNDIVDGGAGIDRAAFFDSLVGVNVSLLLQGSVQDTNQGMDLLTKFEHLSGTKFDDILIGDHDNNYLWGDISPLDPEAGGGNDTLIGNGGNDLLDVGTGDHTLIGNTGVDSVTVFGGSTDTLGGVVLDLNLQGGVQDTTQGMMFLKGIENLSGSVHDDTLTGNANNNILAGQDRDDIIKGGGGADTIWGDGQITIVADFGTAGPITFLSQVLYEEEDDPAGFDQLYGEAGGDFIVGGFGGDTMTGGAGRDIFHYNSIEDSLPIGPDFITDFTKKDQVSLKDIDADVTGGSNEAFHFVGGFSATPAEAWLHYDRDLDLTYLELDVNGDAVADAVIKFEGRVTALYDWEL